MSETWVTSIAVTYFFEFIESGSISIRFLATYFTMSEYRGDRGKFAPFLLNLIFTA